MERREVDGRCLSYYGTKVNPFLRENLASGVLQILAQLPEQHADLPAVVVVNDLLSQPEDLALINLIASPLNPWVTPPGTPEDHLAILRKAFFEAFQDPEFQKLAARAGFELNPMKGEEAESLLKETLDLPKETEQKVKQILGG